MEHTDLCSWICQVFSNLRLLYIQARSVAVLLVVISGRVRVLTQLVIVIRHGVQVAEESPSKDIWIQILSDWHHQQDGHRKDDASNLQSKIMSRSMRLTPSCELFNSSPCQHRRVCTSTEQQPGSTTPCQLARLSAKAIQDLHANQVGQPAHACNFICRDLRNAFTACP